jgi:DNA-binding NarL/FixJ family response regulator
MVRPDERGGVFYGRSNELAQIQDLVRGAIAGRSSGLLVEGEPGVGKTGLLAEAAARAGDGVAVGRAACLPDTAQLPFDPVFGLLSSLGRRTPIPSGSSQRDVFGEVVAELELAAADGPLLLLLDDLHWSDAATLELVHYCLARLSDLPVAWLLATRPASGPRLLAHRLARAGFVRRVELSALTPVDTRRLAEEVLGNRSVGSELAAVLYDRTGGNPFLCEELLRSLEPNRDEGLAAAAGLVPAAVSEAVQERASRLTPVLLRALEWAAVLPEPFAYTELEAVAGADAGSAPELLAEAGFLSKDPEGGWRFLHSILRDAVYLGLPEDERVRRHGQIADTLKGQPLERVALQLESACRYERAADAYLELAQTALNRGHGQDAVRLYERAGELAQRGGEPRSARSAKAGRVLALLSSGASEEARREAASLRSELQADGDEAERLTFLTRYAHALTVMLQDVDGAREALDEAGPLIALAGGVLIAEALAVRASVRILAGEPGRALADAERAAEIAAETADRSVQATTLNVLGLAVGQSGDVSAGMSLLEQALDHARVADLPVEASRACLNLGYLAEYAGQPIGPYARIGLELDGVPAATTTMLHTHLATDRGLQGDLDGALAHALASMRVAARAGRAVEARASTTLIYVHIWRGELAPARKLLDQYAQSATSAYDWRVHELWGLLLEEEGEPAAALAQFQRGAEEDPIGLSCLAGVARTAVAVGQLDAAREAMERLERIGEGWPLAASMRMEARGWIAFGDGHPDEAAQHFQAGAEQTPQAWIAARLRLQTARLTRDRDGIRAAITALDEMGAKRAAHRGRQIARELGVRPGPRRRKGGLLSGREQEVAQLVAAGHTNAEIASALYLSPRTIERHIANILAKLGYRSRIQIAAEAAAGRLPGAS